MQDTHHMCRHCQRIMYASCGKEVTVQDGIVTVVDANVTFPLVWLNSLGHGDERNEVTGYSEICL